MYKILETTKFKIVQSEQYNYHFDKSTGYFARWGKTTADDPEMSPVGPEIADIEISTVCHGVGKPCRFCYKSNGPVGENMDLATFKNVFAALPRVMGQIAFGIGDVEANPDLWAIMQHCRDNGVIPNVTINGAPIISQHYDNLVRLCGAVAVSCYDHDVCYNTVQELTSRGLKQVNIHCLLADETYQDCRQVIQDAVDDPRLKGLNAVVFLALKPKGRGTCLTSMRSVDRYRELVSLAMQHKVGIGFDSCSAPMFLKAMEHDVKIEQYRQLAEPCESMLFSIYVDVKGRAWPCSFLADTDFPEIYLQQVDNFSAVWYNPAVVKWRETLLATATKGLVPGCRECPVYRIYPVPDAV